MTDMLVSCRKWRVVAFTRMTFSAPSALPAIRLGDPRSTYLTGAGKMTWTVLSYVISSPWGGIIRLKPIFRVSPSYRSPLLCCAMAASMPVRRANTIRIFFMCLGLTIVLMFIVSYCSGEWSSTRCPALSTSLKTKCDYFPKRNVIFSRLLTQNEM